MSKTWQVILWSILLCGVVAAIGTEHGPFSMHNFLQIFFCAMAAFFLGANTTEFIDDKRRLKERKPIMDKPVPYIYIPSLPNDEELTFKCGVGDCGQEVKVSALRTHAAMVHNTTLYVTDMTTIRDDKRFTVK